MGTTKQDLYTGALTALGDRKYLTSEQKTAIRALDNVYDKVVEECLTEGSWNFAMQTIKADADTGVEPSFGYSEVFAKPSDWLRTHMVSEDEYFAYPLLQYVDDENYWSADTTPIYARYVSNDTGMGWELSRWTINFQRYVELELALRVCLRLTQNHKLFDKIEKMRDKARRNAKNKDAMNEPSTRFRAPGGWTRARSSRSGRDRGNRNNLTG